jgi:hypothetical protein
MQHVTFVGEVRNACTSLVGNSDRKNHLGDLSLDGRITLKSVLKQ